MLAATSIDVLRCMGAEEGSGGGTARSARQRQPLQSDLTTPGYKYDSAGRLLLESKVDIRKRGCPSPDEADAVALCFAEADGFRANPNLRRDPRERYKGLYA